MSAFRDPLEPSPGHAGNAGGGRLVLALARADEHLDRCWLNLLLAAVGESLDDELGDHVCGLLVSVRAGRPAHLSLWLADAEDAEAIGEIRCAGQARQARGWRRGPQTSIAPYDPPLSPPSADAACAPPSAWTSAHACPSARTPRPAPGSGRQEPPHDGAAHALGRHPLSVACRGNAWGPRSPHQRSLRWAPAAQGQPPRSLQPTTGLRAHRSARASCCIAICWQGGGAGRKQSVRGEGCN